MAKPKRDAPPPVSSPEPPPASDVPNAPEPRKPWIDRQTLVTSVVGTLVAAALVGLLVMLVDLGTVVVTGPCAREAAKARKRLGLPPGD